MQIYGGSGRWRGDVHDRHGNIVFANGSNFNEIGKCGMCGVRNSPPLQEPNIFIVGENIVTMSIREISRRVHRLLIVFGAM